MLHARTVDGLPASMRPVSGASSSGSARSAGRGRARRRPSGPCPARGTPSAQRRRRGSEAPSRLFSRRPRRAPETPAARARRTRRRRAVFPPPRSSSAARRGSRESRGPERSGGSRRGRFRNVRSRRPRSVSVAKATPPERDPARLPRVDPVPRFRSSSAPPRGPWSGTPEARIREGGRREARRAPLAPRLKLQKRLGAAASRAIAALREVPERVPAVPRARVGNERFFGTPRSTQQNRPSPGADRASLAAHPRRRGVRALILSGETRRLPPRRRRYVRSAGQVRGTWQIIPREPADRQGGRRLRRDSGPKIASGAFCDRYDEPAPISRIWRLPRSHRGRAWSRNAERFDLRPSQPGSQDPVVRRASRSASRRTSFPPFTTTAISSLRSPVHVGDREPPPDAGGTSQVCAGERRHVHEALLAEVPEEAHRHRHELPRVGGSLEHVERVRRDADEAEEPVAVHVQERRPPRDVVRGDLLPGRIARPRPRDRERPASSRPELVQVGRAFRPRRSSA